MSLSFPTTTLKKPSGLKATSGIKRPAFGALYGFDSSGGDSGGGTPFANTLSGSFDGTDDYMDIPDSTALETTEFTWSAWFYCTAIDRYNIIVDTATHTSFFNGYEIFVVDSTNKIRFASYHTTDAIDSTTAVTANTWFHVAATHEAGSDKLYVNGSLEASGSASNFNTTDAANLRIGSSSIFSSLYHQGLIDEVSFFNSALSASDITSIYNSGVPNDIGINGLNLNPVGWWRMGDNDGGTGTTITDQGSGGNDGTLVNGPTFSTDVPEYVFNQYSVSFDGANDYMSIPDADVFSMGNGSGTDNAFSISVWFIGGHANDINTFYFATKDASGNREWAFRTVSSQIHFFAFGTGGGYIGRKYGTNLSINQWYNAVVTYDASKASSGIKLYLNGTRVDDADYASGTFTASKNTTAEVRLASLQVNNTFSNGLMDELAIFNTELSASDISTLRGGAPAGTLGLPADISSLNPVGWWRMGDNDSGSGTTVTDQGSGGNDGTLTNGPTFSTSVPS